MFYYIFSSKIEKFYNRVGYVAPMILYFRVKNKVMNKKLKNYFVYKIKNKFTVLYSRKQSTLEHFYSKLYFREENRTEFQMP